MAPCPFENLGRTLILGVRTTCRPETKRVTRSRIHGKGNKYAKSGPVDVQDGDMRSAILEIIQTDQDIMNSVIESVSQAIVTKFMNNPELMDKLTKKVIQSGVLDRVNQELYESCKFDIDNSVDAT